MKLTGECKKDFRKWLVLSDLREQIEKFCKLNLNDTITEAFMELPDSMKWGVFVDFFKSVQIYIGEIPWGLPVKHSSNIFAIKDGKIDIEWDSMINETPEEARTEAIKKADEIRNKKA